MTLRLPDWIARATRSARPRSRVKIEPDRPYSVSLALRDRLGLVVERQHRDHRAEHLLAPDPLLGSTRRAPPSAAPRTPAPSGAGPANATSTSSRYPCTVARLVRRDQRTHLAGAVAPGRCTAMPLHRRLEQAEELVVRRRAGPGSATARSSPGRRCRTRRTARWRPPRRGRRRRRSRWRSCRRARGCTASPGRRSRAMICLPTSVEPVKQTLRTQRVGDEPLADHRALARDDGEHALGQPGLAARARRAGSRSAGSARPA